LEKYFLTIDLGTSALKVMLYDSDFHVASKWVEETETIYPKPNWAEQDQNRWWEITVNSIKKAVEGAEVSPNQIMGIGCCAQMHGLNLVDEECRPLYRCLIWPDLRSIPQAEAIRRDTGLDIHPYYTAAKLLWMLDNHPDVVDEAYKILLPKDFIRAKLSNTFCTDVSDAEGTELFDRQKGTWNKKLVDYIGVPYEKLPDIYPSTAMVGKVSKEAAEKTGLLEGTPVIAGSGDDSIGVVQQTLNPVNSALVYLGTAPALLAYRSTHKEGQDWPFLGGWLSAGGGAVIKWFKEEFGYIEEEVAKRVGTDPYKLLDEEASKVEPGSGGLLFLPHMMGERSPPNPESKGVVFGLSLGHRREQIYRAILEGITYHLKAILDSAIEVDPGIRVEKAIVFGGGAKSALWREIIANVFGLPTCTLSEAETTTLKLACLIAVGLHLYKDFPEAAKCLDVFIVGGVEPSKEIQKEYERLYRSYRGLDEKLFEHRKYLEW